MDNDFELLDAWGAGDIHAGEQLFDRHFSSMYSFFRNKLPDAADDLVQQTFLACVESRDRFARRSSFRTYLFATARNVLRHELRKRGRGEAVGLDHQSIEDLAPSATSLIALDREKRLLLQALRRIPIDYQIALELYHWESLTGPEIAEILELTVPGVRSRLRRANEALRASLLHLAKDPALVESTMARLSDWARAIRDRLAESSS